MAAAGDDPGAHARAARGQGPRGRHHRGARRGGREVHPLAGRDAGVQGLPRLPRLDLRVAQLDGRARHPGPLQARARRHHQPRRRRRSRTAGSPTPRARSRSARSRRSPRKLLDVDQSSRCSPPSSSAGRQPPRRRLARRAGDASRAPGCRVVRSLVGHGIGRDMHEDPQIPNYGEPGRGPAARGGHGARRRADGQRRRATRCAWATTAGRSSPRTARWPPTSSSRSRSPPRARGSSRRGTTPSELGALDLVLRGLDRQLVGGVGAAASPARRSRSAWAACSGA